jgi:hypothetical protein
MYTGTGLEMLIPAQEFFWEEETLFVSRTDQRPATTGWEGSRANL